MAFPETARGLCTTVGILTGGVQRVLRLDPARNLNPQLKEAKHLLAENPHQDQYVNQVKDLKQQIRTARRQAVNKRNAWLVARDSAIGGVLGRLLGEGLARTGKSTIQKTNAFDPKAFREMNRRAFDEWENLMKTTSEKDLLQLSDQVVNAAGVNRLSQAYMDEYHRLKGSYGVLMNVPGEKPFLGVASAAQDQPGLGLVSVSHELMHAFQTKHTKSGYSPVFADKRLPDTLGSFSNIRERLAGTQRLPWQTEDRQIEKLLRKATPSDLGALKTKFIREVQAHRAGIQYAGHRVESQIRENDLHIQAGYKRLVYLIGQEEQRRGLMKARPGFKMRLPGGVKQRLTEWTQRKS